MTDSPPEHARPSVAFVTLGCPKNEADSDRMAASLSATFELVDDVESADTVVVNTCAFIQEAAEESVRVVLELAQGWKTERADRRLVVAGCMPSRYGRDLSDAMPEVDMLLPVTDEDGLARSLAALAGVPLVSAPTDVRTPAPGASAYVKVSDGCHRACTYCAIPAIRGPYRSRTADELVAEAELLVGGGARELVLVGQDVSAWGRDLPGDESLSTLVGRLADVQGLAWLRLLYIQPDGITPDLLEAMAASPVVCRYLDIPMQHASRPVLAAMGRKGRDTDYLRLLGTVRAALPGVALRSTFIAGFPGETRADYERLLRFVRTARLDYTGVFAFSSEEGTAAASLTPKVAARTVRSRVQRLRDLSDEIGFDLAASRIGTRVEVLVEGVDDDGYTVGRHRGQAPEVDGGVLLQGGEGIAPGTIVDAEIVEALGYDLVGEVR